LIRAGTLQTQGCLCSWSADSLATAAARHHCSHEIAEHKTHAERAGKEQYQIRLHGLKPFDVWPDVRAGIFPKNARKSGMSC
jgi:hypothetical protein